MWLVLRSQFLLYYLPIVQAKDLGVPLNSSFPFISDPNLQNWVTSHCHAYIIHAWHLPSNFTPSAMTLLKSTAQKSSQPMCDCKTCQVTQLPCSFIFSFTGFSQSLFDVLSVLLNLPHRHLIYFSPFTLLQLLWSDCS